MTRAANVVVSAGQNGPMMRKRGIVTHQTHRVRIGFGTVVVIFNGDGGGWLGLVGLGGVGGVFGFGVVPNYRGAGTAASAASTAAISASATAGHGCIVSMCWLIEWRVSSCCYDGRSSRGRSFCFVRLRHFSP